MLARVNTHSLIPAYRELHRKGKFPGLSIEPYIGRIAELVHESGAKTMLDYGCGKGEQYTKKQWHQAWGFMPALYDPAVPGIDRKPRGKFDCVISTDVLEHVPESEISRVTAELAAYTRYWCFISVCCRQAKVAKRLPDGRNVHVTIRPPEWWAERLQAAFHGGLELYLAYTP